MNKHLNLFHPSKKKLAVFIFILLISSFSLYGNLSGNITTYDQDQSQWINQLIMVWSFTSIIGAVFQSPIWLLAQFLPEASGQLGSILFTSVVLLNSYVMASLIGIIWETRKTEQEKNYLRAFAGGLFFSFIGLVWLGINESSNDALVIISGGLVFLLAIFCTKKFASKIYKPILAITFLLVFGFLGFALSDFEESYCWNYKYGPGSEFSDHMDCHKKFNLYKAISESFN